MIKINNLEISQEDLIKEVQNNPEMMKMLQEKFEKKEGWFVPKEGEKYFILFGDGEYTSYIFSGDVSDIRITNFQKVYRTDEEAQQASLRQRAKIRILKTIAEENAKVGWVCDWWDTLQRKYSLCFDYKNDSVYVLGCTFAQEKETDFHFGHEIGNTILEKCAEDYKIYIGFKQKA